MYCIEGELPEEMLDFMEENENEFDTEKVREETHIDTYTPEQKRHIQEHKLIYTSIHKKFCDKFETKIEDFIRDAGYSPRDFYTFLKDLSKEDSR